MCPGLAQTRPKQPEIISMDSDPMRLKQPLWGFPVHVPITCDSSKSLPLLAQMTDEFITAERRKAFAERKSACRLQKERPTTQARAAIEKARTAFPLSPVWIRECVNRISDENTVLALGDCRDRSGRPDSAGARVFAVCSQPGQCMAAGGRNKNGCSRQNGHCQRRRRFGQYFRIPKRSCGRPASTMRRFSTLSTTTTSMPQSKTTWPFMEGRTAMRAKPASTVPTSHRPPILP